MTGAVQALFVKHPQTQGKWWNQIKPPLCSCVDVITRFESQGTASVVIIPIPQDIHV